MMATEVITNLFHQAVQCGETAITEENGASSHPALKDGMPPIESSSVAWSDDISSDNSSSTAPLAFEHVATNSVVQELNQFEIETRQQYETVLPLSSTTSHTTHLHNRKSTGSYTWDDISIDCVLGEGAFSFVFQVQIKESNDESAPPPPPAAATAVVSRNNNKTNMAHAQQQFALKCLKAKAISQTTDLTYNAMDLYVEAQILSRVQHPHIIQLAGISSTPNNNKLGDAYARTDGYFLVLEIMETTLLDKLQLWRSEIKDDKSRRRQLISEEQVIRRLLQVAVPVASAVAYLHAHDIVIRDVKPENIGFDSAGTVKLFDFGLARWITTVMKDDIAGSVCYMAPEVLLGQGTDLQSDVYSLTMVLWELCTLELPMARFQTVDQIKQKVAKGHWRPSLSSVTIPKLRKQWIAKGWAKQMDQRPTAHDFHLALQQICGLEIDEVDESVSSQSNSSKAKSLPLPTSKPTTNDKAAPKRIKSFQIPGRSLFNKMKG